MPDMKTKILKIIQPVLLVLSAACMAGTAQAQIFVSYFPRSGNPDNATIGEYSTSGASISASLISGLDDPLSLASDGNGHLFEANFGNNTIGEYSTSGATINASLISGLNNPHQMVLDGNGDLFVANLAGTGTIGEYNATTGATISASLISGLGGNGSLAFDGNGDLFVATSNGTIGEYNATTGAAIHASLVSGINDITGIVVVVPEPSTFALAAFGAAGLLACRRTPVRTHSAPRL